MIIGHDPATKSGEEKGEAVKKVMTLVFAEQRLVSPSSYVLCVCQQNQKHLLALIKPLRKTFTLRTI